MQNQRVEAAIDPIRQKLGEYCDEAIETLARSLDADSESVRVQAARDILQMAGYKPHSGNDRQDEKVPTIIMGGTVNIGSNGMNGNGATSEVIAEYHIGDSDYDGDHEQDVGAEESTLDRAEAAPSIDS